jgi:hypothetical protein
VLRSVGIPKGIDWTAGIRIDYAWRLDRRVPLIVIAELVFRVRLILDYLLDFRSCYSQSRFDIGFQLGYRFGNLTLTYVGEGGKGCLFVVL